MRAWIVRLRMSFSEGSFLSLFHTGVCSYQAVRDWMMSDEERRKMFNIQFMLAFRIVYQSCCLGLGIYTFRFCILRIGNIMYGFNMVALWYS